MCLALKVSPRFFCAFLGLGFDMLPDLYYFCEQSVSSLQYDWLKFVLKYANIVQLKFVFLSLALSLSHTNTLLIFHTYTLLIFPSNSHTRIVSTNTVYRDNSHVYQLAGL